MGYKKNVQTKKHSGIQDNSREENMNHPVVKILTLAMRPFYNNTFRAIYDLLGYYLSAADKEMQTLYEQKIIVPNDELANIQYISSILYNQFHINHNLLCDILRNIDDDELNAYPIIIRKAYAASRYKDQANGTPEESTAFGLALHSALQGKPVDDEMIEVCNSMMSKFELDYEGVPPYSTRIIPALIRETALMPLLSRLPEESKHKIRFEHLCELEALKYQNFTPASLALYFDEKGKPYNELDAAMLTLYTELLQQGNIGTLLEKHRNTPLTHTLLTAINELHNGNANYMIKMVRFWIEEYKEFSLLCPLMQFFLAAAFMLDKNGNNKTFESKLRKSRDVRLIAPMLRLMLEYKQTGTINDKILEEMKDNQYDSIANGVFFGLLAKHFQTFNISKNNDAFYDFHAGFIEKSNYTYLKMLFAAENPKAADEYKRLQQETKMSSPLPHAEKKEDWELTIDKLLLLVGTNATDKKPTQASSTARVAYLIDTSLYVQPLLQRSSNGVTWTAGRNIALKTFAENKTEGMTQTDMAVASMVKIYRGYYGNTEYSLKGPKVISMLVGHPNVYTYDAARLKVEIVKEPLQISVTTDSRGNYNLKSNITYENVAEGFYIDVSNRTNIRVVPVSPSEVTLVAHLKQLSRLPSKAKDKLSELLTKLSGRVTVMSDLIATDKDKVKQKKASALITVQLLPDNDNNIRATLFAKPLTDTPPYLTPGKGIEYVSGQVKGQTVQTKRNLKEEKKNLQAVESILQLLADENPSDGVWSLSVEHTLSLLDKLKDMTKEACVEWPEGVRMKVTRPHIMPADLHLSVHKMSDWFEVEGKVRIDEHTELKIAELLRLLRESKGRFVRLGDTEYVALSEHLAKQLKNIARLTEGQDKQVKVSTFSAQLIDELEQAGVDLKADNAYRTLLKNIAEADNVKFKTPKGIQADLRDYQKEGFQWLSRLAHWGAGACLADDMGLGKTLQTITLLFARRTEGPSLVVAPTSVILNWQDEINRFAPTLQPILLNRQTSRSEAIKNAKPHDVVITSYGLLVTEQELLAAKEWNVVALDEAHTIKNRDTKMSKAAMTLKASMRVALTGTPLQNRLSEIWNIFQFLNPGLLGSFQQFTDNFILPIEKNNTIHTEEVFYNARDRRLLLKRIISPFILRRTKSDVLSELPEKTEITIKVNLSEEEQALYENLRQQAVLTLTSGGTSAIQAIAEITKLRQAACHPQLIDPKLTLESAKANAFMELVANLHDNHHRALVFSQFTSHLAIIRAMLDREKIAYLYLDGSTTPKQRALLVEKFQTGDTPLFLISLKAGGLGLNLTAADYVIHLDPWWNPAIEDQASDRSHRIGQHKPVTVYRIIASDTIEEKILRLHSQKRSLADALLEGTDMSARMTKDDILNLLNEM